MQGAETPAGASLIRIPDQNALRFGRMFLVMQGGGLQAYPKDTAKGGTRQRGKQAPKIGGDRESV
jgi:hypothetical protein